MLLSIPPVDASGLYFSDSQNRKGKVCTPRTGSGDPWCCSRQPLQQAEEEQGSYPELGVGSEGLKERVENRGRGAACMAFTFLAPERGKQRACKDLFVGNGRKVRELSKVRPSPCTSLLRALDRCALPIAWQYPHGSLSPPSSLRRC